LAKQYYLVLVWPRQKRKPLYHLQAESNREEEEDEVPTTFLLHVFEGGEISWKNRKESFKNLTFFLFLLSFTREN
jgi:hypothetical protein